LLRFELFRGRLDAVAHEQELERLRALLRASTETHHQQFLEAWEQQT
jgi:hypothetical protein